VRGEIKGSTLRKDGLMKNQKTITPGGSCGRAAVMRGGRRNKAGRRMDGPGIFSRLKGKSERIVTGSPNDGVAGGGIMREGRLQEDFIRSAM